jgi:hypothetical protein
MMTRLLLIALPLLSLSACDTGRKVEGENAAVAEVPEKVAAVNADAPRFRPGKWASTTTIEALEIPGMPPEAAEYQKKMMRGIATGIESCLTPEQAARPNEGFFAGQEGNCRYDRYSAEAGKLSAVMRCGSGDSAQLVEFEGSFAPEQYELRMVSKAEGPAARTMTMKINARRIGECDDKAAPAR